VKTAINVSTMTSVTSRTQQYRYYSISELAPCWNKKKGKLRLKRWRKTGSDCVDVTWCGRLFQLERA